MVNNLKMGDFFGECREKSGYTQHEVATFVGVSDKTIQNLESGRNCTDFTTIMNLCDLFEVPLSKLNQFYTRDQDMDYAIDLYKKSDKCKRKRKNYQLI